MSSKSEERTRCNDGKRHTTPVESLHTRSPVKKWLLRRTLRRGMPEAVSTRTAERRLDKLIANSQAMRLMDGRKAFIHLSW